METLWAFLESDPDIVGSRALEELVDLSAADIRDASGSALPIPTAIRTSVEARVERLNAQARQILEASAVLGQIFAFDLVRRTAGHRELETVVGLDELVTRHLLREEGSGYRSVHLIIQAVVYRGLIPPRTRHAAPKDRHQLQIYQFAHLHICQFIQKRSWMP